jgi:HAD superfamily hydrolase (TIGR01509 family)
VIRAVLFDFDGVLVSTVDLHARTFREAAEHVWGALPLDIEGDLNGLSTREKLAHLTRTCGLPREEHEPIWQEKQRRTLDAIRSEIGPDPVKAALMEGLSRDGLRLACVSNASRETTVLALRLADLFRHFEFVLTNEDVARQKPSPEPYLEAFRRLGLPPGECLIVEDSPHGIRSAQESGAHLVVAPSYRDVTYEFVCSAIRSREHAP